MAPPRRCLPRIGWNMLMSGEAKREPTPDKCTRSRLSRAISSSPPFPPIHHPCRSVRSLRSAPSCRGLSKPRRLVSCRSNRRGLRVFASNLSSVPFERWNFVNSVYSADCSFPVENRCAARRFLPFFKQIFLNNDAIVRFSHKISRQNLKLGTEVLSFDRFDDDEAGPIVERKAQK